MADASVCGLDGLAKPQDNKQNKISDTLDIVGKELKEEREALMQARELVMKEIGVLKAEEVTMQRLLAAHTQPSPSKKTQEKIQKRSSLATADPTSPLSSLPQINLDIHGSKQGKHVEVCEGSEEEYDSEEDQS